MKKVKTFARVTMTSESLLVHQCSLNILSKNKQILKEIIMEEDQQEQKLHSSNNLLLTSINIEIIIILLDLIMPKLMTIGQHFLLSQMNSLLLILFLIRPGILDKISIIKIVLQMALISLINRGTFQQDSIFSCHQIDSNIIEKFTHIWKLFQKLVDFSQ